MTRWLFAGPLAAVKIGLVNGNFVVNPDRSTLETSELSLVVAGTHDAVMMVEAGANELSEEDPFDSKISETIRIV